MKNEIIAVFKIAAHLGVGDCCTKKHQLDQLSRSKFQDQPHDDDTTQITAKRVQD